MKYNYNQKWRYERKLRGLPNNLKRILIDNSSLTKRIIGNKSNHVKLISSHISLTSRFDNSSKKYSLIRKVELKGNLDKSIKAVSYTPVHTIQGSINHIKYLKEKSLATILFRNHSFIKYAINYCLREDDVLRVTLFKKNKTIIRVEEAFPIKNNYDELSIIDCRKNLIN
jgi:chorismate-pyruvate lyase